MRQAYILSLLLMALLFACEFGGEEEEPVKECTDPDFGETISSMSGFRDGVGFISIGKVWGTAGELSYEWEHGATGPDLNNLSPGIYTVTISNSEGCSATEQFVLDLGSGGQEGYSLGDEGPAGGIVFYVNDDGSGLEAAPVSSIWSNVRWGCEGTEIDTQQERGTGLANTIKIVNECQENNIAASLCEELELNGYDDWYLPSTNELDQLGWTIYQEDLSGFPAGNYWSSTEAFSTMAYREYLPDGGGDMLNKSTGAYVIAIRTFEGQE